MKFKKKEAKNSPVVKNPKFSISNHTLLKFFLSFQYSSNVISQEPYYYWTYLSWQSIRQLSKLLPLVDRLLVLIEGNSSMT